MSRRSTRRKSPLRRAARRPRRRAPRVRTPHAGLLVALALGAALLAVSAGRVTVAGSLALVRWPELPEFSLPTIPLPDLASRLRVPQLRLRAVEFLGLATLESGELMGRLELPSLVALIDVDPREVCDTLARHPRVGECRALRLPPGRLIVAIEEREPLAVLERTRQGIDEDGQRFALGSEELVGLPRIHGEPRAAVLLARAAREAGVKLARIDVRGDDGLVFEPVGRPLRVRVVGDPQRALEAWLRLEMSGLVEEHAAGEVDLRFRGGAVLRDFRDNKGGK